MRAAPRVVPRLARAAVALGVLACVAWFFRDLDFSRVWEALRGASMPLVLLAAGANLTLNTALRVHRWRALLPPSPRSSRAVGFWELCALWLASQATNNVIPFRAGEAVRTLGLRDRHGYPVPTLVATQLVEKLVELMSLTTLAVPLLLSARMPVRSLVAMFGLAFAGAIGVALTALLARAGPGVMKGDGLVPRLVRRTAGAVHLLGDPGVWLRSFGWALASDVTDVLMIGLCVTAVGIHLGPLGWGAVLLAVNLAIVVPSSPGQLGVLEAAAVLMLVWLGVDRGAALAFALLYHAAHVLPITAAGGLALVALQRRRRTP